MPLGDPPSYSVLVMWVQTYITGGAEALCSAVQLVICYHRNHVQQKEKHLAELSGTAKPACRGPL